MHITTNQCTHICAVVLQNDTAFFTCEPITYLSLLLAPSTSCTSASLTPIGFGILASQSSLLFSMFDFDILQIPIEWNRICSGCSTSSCTSLDTCSSSGLQRHCWTLVGSRNGDGDGASVSFWRLSCWLRPCWVVPIRITFVCVTGCRYELNSFVTKTSVQEHCIWGFHVKLAVLCSWLFVCVLLCQCALPYKTLQFWFRTLCIVNTTVAGCKSRLYCNWGIGECSRLLWTVHLSYSASRQIYLSEVM